MRFSRLSLFALKTGKEALMIKRSLVVSLNLEISYGFVIPTKAGI